MKQLSQSLEYDPGIYSAGVGCYPFVIDKQDLFDMPVVVRPDLLQPRQNAHVPRLWGIAHCGGKNVLAIKDRACLVANLTTGLEQTVYTSNRFSSTGIFGWNKGALDKYGVLVK